MTIIFVILFQPFFSTVLLSNFLLCKCSFGMVGMVGTPIKFPVHVFSGSSVICKYKRASAIIRDSI